VQPTSDREAIEKSEEGTRNRSFDHYQKTILTGTNYQTRQVGGTITVERKSRIIDD